jgi:hypothetical protein
MHTTSSNSEEPLIQECPQHFLCQVLRLNQSEAAITIMKVQYTTPSNKKASLLLHRKKKVREFPVPSRDVTTKLSLGGNNDVITELFLPRGNLVGDIPAGDGKLVNLFFTV